MTLFYVPLESYPSRYTMQWAAPKTGWLERNWIRSGVDYVRVDGDEADATRVIKTGCVLDAVGRSLHCFSQVGKILKMAEAGQIKDTDVLYFDDFWSPGMEALPYALGLMGVRPRAYAFLHAQSVDEFDFTHQFKRWMRPIETGFGEWLDGIFVCCPTLKDLVCFGGIAERSKVHVTGHPFNSEEVMERMPSWYANYIDGGYTPAPDDRHGKRKNQVVWSSRFDGEKNPMFFITVAEQMIREGTDVKFVVCTSAPKLRSNYPAALVALNVLIAKHPDKVELREGLSKEAYYETLCESKVQFNSADQDFVAITLLEASVAGCYPVYPYFRSFPETFLYRPGYMHQRLDIQDAVRSINRALAMTDAWTPEAIRSRSWIHSRFDSSWLRMLNQMQVPYDVKALGPVEYAGALKDPFRLGDWPTE